MPGAHKNFSLRAYGLLLFAYPAEFRNLFRDEMIQTFSDCYRAKGGEGVAGILRLWVHTLVDLIFSAVREHRESEGSFMNNPRKFPIAMIGCAIVIVTALILMSYGRKHEVSSILAFGYFLDALATTGILGNIIVFLLAKFTKFDSLRVAITTFLVVHAVPLLLVVFIAGPHDPRFNVVATAVGYVGSFLFWVLFHWMSSKTGNTLSRREANG
jgi:hypothetical protein